MGMSCSVYCGLQPIGLHKLCDDLSFSSNGTVVGFRTGGHQESSLNFMLSYDGLFHLLRVLNSVVLISFDAFLHPPPHKKRKKGEKKKKRKV